jgi:hypothetical protein
MKRFIRPPRDARVSTQCAIAAITDGEPAVVVQDERGSQIIVSPKMARQLAKQLTSMANIAEGFSNQFLQVFPEKEKCLIQ